VAIRWVLVRDPARTFEPQALRCADQDADAVHILAWFVKRRAREVTFHEVRTHPGVQTQRHWSDLAILCPTPALLGLCSLVTIVPQQRLDKQPLPTRQAAWSTKTLPTFSDTLAVVRPHFWPSAFVGMSSSEPDVVNRPRALFVRLVDTLAFTA
jgi:hypothetical protein